MKKSAFVLGYTGGILALVFSLLMVYLVPINFVTKTVEDIKNEMKNENIIALNEVGWYIINHPDDPITDYSEKGLIDYAAKVAGQSDILNDEYVYEDTMAFTYGIALDGIVSAALVGISIIFALTAFLGSLVIRKHSTGGAVVMLVSSLVLMLSSIKTGTLIPMAAASAVLAAAGIFAFIPARRVPAEFHARNRQKPQVKPGFAAYPQPQDQPQYAQPPQAPVQASVTQEAPVQASGATQAGVPFPEEDVQVFTQADPEDVK